MAASKKGRTGRRGRKRGASTLTLAQQADRHVLYERAVQCVEAEIDFVDSVFTKLRGHKARHLREDFCATASTACEWVRRRRRNTAVGIDIDPKVLGWARANNMARLSPAQQKRIALLQSDVMDVCAEPVDVVLAMNFSYWALLERERTVRYFSQVHRDLADDGILFLDAYGGQEAYAEAEEETDHGDFVYVWDQHRYDPIKGRTTCYIHFRFRDGSKIKRAFEYHWRLWTLPEISEMLAEAGFLPTVYWEGTDRKGNGNGVFRPATEGSADACWIAYIVAQK